MTSVVIGTEAKWVTDANTRTVCITTNVSSGSGILSYELNQVDYIVPVGKVFTPIRIHAENSDTTTNTPFELWFGTTVDSTTGGTLFAKFRNSGEGSPINFDMGAPEIAAGNYISLRNTTSGNVYTTIIGVEANA